MPTIVDPGDVDRLFLLVMAILVFVMQSGFCMLESGSVTKVNIDTIIFKSVLDICTGALIYWALGYMFAFGGDFNANCGDCNGFIGVENPFLIGLTDLAFIFFFFEFCFCGASATIVSGAIAERMKWQGYIIHATFFAGWIFPVVSHWIWSSNGWLSVTAPASRALFGRGAMDYAGSGVVHLVGGSSSIIAAKAVGYRNEFLTDEDRRTAKNAKLYVPRFEWDAKNSVWRVNELPPSDKNIATLGVWILWFGWYGFNCGSIITLNGKTGLIGRVAINTTLGGATAAIVGIAIGRVMNHDQLYLKYNLGDLNNGALAGIVSITANCSYTHPWAAIAIGAIGAIILKLSSALLLHPKIRIDDPLDASPVHGFCGAWGVIANGVFAVPAFMDQVAITAQRGGGLFYGYGLNLIIQIITVLCIIAWTMAWTCVTFGIMYFIDRNRGTNAYFLIRGQQNYGLGFGYHDPENITTKFTNANEVTTGWINPDIELDDKNEEKKDN